MQEAISFAVRDFGVSPRLGTVDDIHQHCPDSPITKDILGYWGFESNIHKSFTRNRRRAFEVSPGNLSPKKAESPTD
jgi:hypothetical protein